MKPTKTNPLFGCMLNEIPFPNMPVLFKNNGLDFFIIDTEHGAFDSSALSGLIMTARLCHLPVIVRLPDNTRRDVTRLVDMGVDGLLLPMTHNRQDIEPVIRFAKYAPVGQRGCAADLPRRRRRQNAGRGFGLGSGLISRLSAGHEPGRAGHGAAERLAGQGTERVRRHPANTE